MLRYRFGDIRKRSDSLRKGFNIHFFARMAYRILIVDDEDDIREFIRYNLTKEGYEVHTAADGAEGLLKAEQTRPHLILLDVMMPVMDGRQTCEAIRRHPQLKDTMVVFLSALCGEESLVVGYNAGADDYITKPVSMRVLCGRINAIMKRIGDSDNRITIEPGIMLDINRHSLFINDTEHALPRKEFDILRLLCNRPEHIISRQEIFSSVWGDGIVVGDRTLDVHIRRLRRKLGNDRIVTHKGVGFKYQKR